MAPLELSEKYDHYDFPIEAPEPLEGHAGHLTPEQQAKVHQLRMLLEAEGLTERLDTLTLVWKSRLSGLRLGVGPRPMEDEPEDI
jgi:hypothetical protein